MGQAENIRAEKARQLRYKKSVAEGFNIYEIKEELWDIMEECDTAKYYIDVDEAELIAALDGDEEEAFEFKMMFTNLLFEAEQLGNILDDSYVNEYFDDFFAAVAHGATQLIGYDDYEDDYFKMTDFEQDLGESESAKRLMRLTKEKLISIAKQCFGVASAILNIRYKYSYLKAAIDVLKGENSAYLQIIKDIEEAYEKATADNWKDTIKFDRLVAEMPARAWLE